MEKKLDGNEEINNKKKFKIEYILHILISSFLSIICIWDRLVNIPKFPKNFLFLTQIDLYINMLYYFICLYYNTTKKAEIKGKYQLFFNFNFCASFVVFIMYWSMFIFARETLYKKDSKLIAPFSLNILLHGGVFIINIFEIILTRKRAKNSYIKIWFFLFFTIVYVGILYLAKLLFNIKVYPFIYGSIFKFIIVTVSSFIVCLIGNFIYSLIMKTKKAKSKEKDFEELEMN